MNVNSPKLVFFVFVFCFWLHGMWDLSSPRGIKPMPPAVEAQSPNHWAAREFLPKLFLYLSGLSWFQETKTLGFPGGAVVENLPANAGDTGSSPGLGRSHMPRSD